MKSVLISIQPKWCELIASGKKTLEVRKTRPKLETPFKVYIYCTKNKEKLVDVIHDGDDMGDFIHRGKPNFIKGYKDLSIYGLFNGGKVIGEFVCDEITEYPYETFNDGEHFMPYGELEKTCLDGWELYDYLGTKDGYGWHISDLVIYDKPKELWEFKSAATYGRKLRTEFFGKDPCCVNDYRLTRPPQSWCYVERSDNNGE